MSSVDARNEMPHLQFWILINLPQNLPPLYGLVCTDLIEFQKVDFGANSMLARIRPSQNEKWLMIILAQ